MRRINHTTYQMELNPVPFALIKAKRKTIEMRLFDERRLSLKIGDYIEFINNENNEKITAEILDLQRFPSFKELYAYYPKELLGYSKEETANPDDMLLYYSKERIAKYSALAIQIKLI